MYNLPQKCYAKRRFRPFMIVIRVQLSFLTFSISMVSLLLCMSTITPLRFHIILGLTVR
uniref:Uncharacterized protein n=1 Tax=Picea glauca TaxID=3330 RepID=A0A101M5Q8_PICGL|nr:hypothetical protein ABT39_MTgene1209 [Picea glauca]